MAADILEILIEANLAAAAAVLLVLAVRKPARQAFGARVGYALWLAAPLAVGASLLPPRIIVLSNIAPTALADIASVPVLASPVIAPVASTAPFMDGGALLIALWLAGAGISLGLLAWSQSRFMKSLGGVVPEGRFLRARASGSGPAVVGALFPKIVLPSDFETRYDAGEQKVVLAHEAAHLAAGDALVNAAIALAQCLFWFNPLIHLAARIVRVDQELACDAAVLSAYPQMRRSYGQALLKTQIAAAPLPLGCYWPAGASNPLKERIAMLKSSPPSRLRRLCGGVGVLALCLGAGVAAWAAQPATISLQATPAIETATPAKPLVERDLNIAEHHPAALATSLVERELNITDHPVAVDISRPLAASTRSFAISPTAARAETVGSDAGNTYQRIDADPAPERLYALRVTMPDGAQKMVTTGQSPLGTIAVEETDAYRAAVKVYAAAKQEEAARLARGASPQPFTPELETALKTMSDFRLEVSTQQRAAFEARNQPIRVTSPGGPRGVRTFTYWVPKNLTAQGKANGLRTLDSFITSAKSSPLRESSIRAREILAARPTTG